MRKKPTYDELEKQVHELERTVKELKQAEIVSRSEKASVDGDFQLRDLTANIPGVMFQFRATRDHAYIIDFFSDKTKDMFGLEPDPENFFHNFHRCIPDDEKQRFLDSVRGAVDRVESWNYEGRFIKPDGKTIWFSGASVPRDEGDHIVFYGLLIDISRRKEIEASLHLTQFCFDSAAVGIFHLRSDGRILNVNTHAAGMLGYTVEEMSGFFVWDIDPDAHPDTFEAGWRKLVAAGVAFFEVAHIRKDGSRIPVEVTSKLLEYHGRQFIICFGQDISERKRIESEREKLVKELQEALENVKTLSGLLPICSSCKKVRDDRGYWNQIESYLHAHSEAQFTHGLCPDCASKLYPDYFPPKD